MNMNPHKARRSAPDAGSRAVLRRAQEKVGKVRFPDPAVQRATQATGMPRTAEPHHPGKKDFS